MNDEIPADPALAALEARLAAAAPRLPAGQREQLLYQSAFAAGQTAALRASASRTRQWMGAATLLAALSLVLGYWLLRPASDDSRQNQVAAQPERVFAPPQSSADAKDDHSRHLSVATPLDRAADFNWPRQTLSAESASAAPASDLQEPVLTPLSRIFPESNWN